MSTPLFELKQVVKTYQRDGLEPLTVLKGVNLTINEKEFVTIAGKSGSGKSTVLHLMAALDKPSSGDIYFQGEELAKQNDQQISQFRNNHIGFVFQFHHLLPEFSAFENVLIPSIIYPKSSRKEIEKRAKQLLELVGLTTRLDHKPNQLSGGEQQRVAIARALMNQPTVLLGDEPTGNLDTTNSQMVLELFQNIHKEFQVTVILVTHNPEIAEAGTTKLLMSDGVLS